MQKYKMNCCFTKPITKPNIHLRTSRCSSQIFISEVSSLQTILQSQSHWVRNRNEVCKKFPAKCTHLSEGRIGMKPLYTKSSTWPLPNSHIGEDIYYQMTKCYVQGIESSAGISTDRTKETFVWLTVWFCSVQSPHRAQVSKQRWLPKRIVRSRWHVKVYKLWCLSFSL